MTAEQLPFYTYDLDDPLRPPSLYERLDDLVAEFGYEAVVVELRRFTPAIEAASAPARWGDPETSHAAAKRDQDVSRFSAKSRQAKLLQLFLLRDLTDQGATISLVGSHAAPSAFDGCRRRMSDLRAAGYLCDSGRRRKSPGSDADSIIWTLTNAGRAALDSLEVSGWSKGGRG